MDNDVEMAEALGLCGVILGKKARLERSQNEERDNSWWRSGYHRWDNSAFKKRLRISWDTFQFILDEIRDIIVKKPTCFNPEPTPPKMQLAIRLYCLADGCTYNTVGVTCSVSLNPQWR